MIIDTLDNLGKYAALSPLMATIAEYLDTHDLSELDNGKHYLQGRDLFINVTDTRGRTRQEAVIETHKRMLDIQIPLSASETYGYTPLCRLPEADYNDEKDVTKYGDLQAEQYVTCEPGMFALFLPEDGHAPCISEAESLHKAIVKMKTF